MGWTTAPLAARMAVTAASMVPSKPSFPRFISIASSHCVMAAMPMPPDASS
ncbi:hypothetical protein D3C83_267100 [compost metagenome]